MKPRVERFRFKSARVVRQHAPWAERIVRVGSIFVAYERAEDADEEHVAAYGSLRTKRGENA